MTNVSEVNHIIADARKALAKRDRLAQQLRQADAEVNAVTKRYSVEMKLWGFTSSMLRHAVEARTGKKIAA
jgi:hypothetical protein